MNEQVGPSLKFDQGTLLLSGFTQSALEKIFPGVPWQFDSRVGQFRTDARWYGEVSTQLHRVAGQVENDVQRWQKVAWSKVCLPELRKQQSEALDALNSNGYCGLVVMPTGTGKTVVALEAARRLAISTLFVAPIRDLMYQWHRRIQELLGYDAGIIGDNTFNVRAISVTTYDSATIHMHSLGNRFGLLVFDECHHLPGDFYRDAALMSAAPHRIGLTATPERADGKHQLLSQLIGKTVYELKLSEATGSLLADYRVVTRPSGDT